MSDPSTRGWGPGWPTDRRADMVNVPPYAGGVHHRIAELVERITAEWRLRGFKLYEGWCWGYADRAIKGTHIPSYHSWGLAVDVNAPLNPYDLPPYGAHQITARDAELWKGYGFRWGGDYGTNKDWMHFEFMGTPADADELTVRARKELAMTDAERQMLERGAVAAAIFDGMSLRLKGEPEPKEPGPMRRGWRMADKFMRG